MIANWRLFYTLPPPIGVGFFIIKKKKLLKNSTTNVFHFSADFHSTATADFSLLIIYFYQLRLFVSIYNVKVAYTAAYTRHHSTTLAVINRPNRSQRFVVYSMNTNVSRLRFVFFLAWKGLQKSGTFPARGNDKN